MNIKNDDLGKLLELWFQSKKPRLNPKQSSRQHFTNRIEVYTINLTLNLLLPNVVLTHVTICSSKSTDFYTVKMLHTNSPICDFQISTQRFRSSTMVDLMQQLYSIIGSIVFTRSLAVAPKGFGKSPILCTKHYPLKMCKNMLQAFYLNILKFCQNPRSNG